MEMISPGVPNWVDLGTPDVADACRFYPALFGWTAQVMPRPEGGDYALFRLGGRVVAGAGPLDSAGERAAWTTFVATDDVDALAARATGAGGQVLMAPFDLGDQARLALFRDPVGAVFGAWQAGTMSGADVYNVPGALTWSEFMTRDPAGAKAFYGTVFGWQIRDMPLDSTSYTLWQVDGRDVGGMMPMLGAEWPADLSPHWMVYFGVGDTDATAVRASELGGSVAVSPVDLPQGRFAVLNDPQGAVFSIITVAAS